MNSISEKFFNLLFNDDFFEILKKSTNLPFRVIKKADYQWIEYDIKINLLTFCSLNLPLKITVIGFPVSVCEKGFSGDFEDILNDLKKRKGIFLFLNDEKNFLKAPFRSGKTLPNCVFYNNFENFEEYLKSLRSPYRRRLNIALKKGRELSVKKVEKEDFTDEMHRLYLNVLEKSKYPLERLNKDFFNLFDSEIFVFYKENLPVAFVQLKKTDETLNFVFGGMDYEYRNSYDLYFNMLILILKKGIEKGCKLINFGQTAEQSKLRLGCKLQTRYMHVFSGNKLIDFILTKLMKHLEYKEMKGNLKVFKNEH